MSKEMVDGTAGRAPLGAAGYVPIRDYALIGDCHGSALVSKDGSVDWCCLMRFDADPLFCRLLDHEKGGFFSLAPAANYRSARAYLGETNILATTFTTSGGTVTVRDFMPVGRRPGNHVHDYVRLNAPGWIVRVVDGVDGAVDMRLRYRPSERFARGTPSLAATPGAVTSDFGPTLRHRLPSVTVDGDLAEGTFRVEPGQSFCFVCTGDASDADPVVQADRLFDVTQNFWSEWIDYCRYDGPHREIVRRSALALKLLTYAPTGAIVAAPTTSLPEEIGGARNWDYRYCWLRDSAFSLYALAVLGYGGEAECFSHFLSIACGETAPDLRIMYGIDGEADLPESELTHLDGYAGSRPVRVGNGAYHQRQMDVFGEVLDWADMYTAIGGGLNRASRRMLAGLADFVAAHWHEPDQGLWEMRGPPRHHVHSKIMSWVALDRAEKVLGKRASWTTARDALEQEIKAKGVGEAGNLLQAYDSGGLDAAALMTPLLGFPLARETLEATVRAIQTRLRTGDLVHRYCGDDGLEGNEGAFLICSFWLVDALLVLGRAEEAETLFDRLIAQANDVGLFAEEIEPRQGAFLGNFPQAFTHLALIASASHLGLCRRGGCAALSGTYADRAGQLVGATLGWRAVWAAMKATGRVGRIRSSRASILRFGPKGKV